MDRKRNFSRQRQVIFEAITQTKEHPTAEQVYEMAREKCPTLGLATVYRNIAKLKEDGHIISVGVVDGHDRLDGTVSPHPHFVCRECNAVIDVDISAVGDTMCHDVKKRYGVIPEHYDITFWGHCADCQNKK